MQHHRRLAAGTILMGASNILKIIVQLICLPLIARLLGPTEYGIFGLAMPMVMLMLMIADSGLGQSLAREPETNWQVWSSAFWFLLMSGVVLAVVTSGASFGLAMISHQPRLPPLMSTLSICLIFLTLAVPGNALLTRHGRIGVNSVGDAAGNVVGSAVAIVLAIKGAGCWSIVAQTLLIYSIRTAYIMIAAPYIPKFHFAFKDLRPHFAMGSSILGIRLADAGGRTIENTLISRLIGASMVGTYSFANTAPRFISESFGNALWATLYAHAIRAKDDAASLRAFAATLRIFSLLVFPIMVLIAAQAHQVIAVLLGARWQQSALMLQVLLLTAALNCIGSLGSALLYAKGRSDIQFRIGVELTVLRIICVACLPWLGIQGMLAGFTVTYIYIFFRNMHASTSFMKVSMLPYLAEMRGPGLASAAAGLACWYAGRLTHASFVTIAVEMTLSLLLYCLILLLTERRKLHGDLTELLKLVKRA